MKLRVAVVDSGVAGTSTAYHLMLIEAAPRPGAHAYKEVCPYHPKITKLDNYIIEKQAENGAAV